jgi:uncharacterized membrane protein HdeD (DUF308 family)
MVKDWLNVGWKALVVRGVIGIIIGILAIAWPIETAIAFAILWGFWALMDGIGSIVQAFQPEETRGGRVWLIVMGIIALIAAFFAIFSPAMAAATLTWILGIWLIVRGVFEVIGAFGSSVQMPRWLLLVSAALSIVLGILFVANPGASAVGLAVLFGIMAIVWGIAFIVLGVIIRKDLATAQPEAPPGGSVPAT